MPHETEPIDFPSPYSDKQIASYLPLFEHIDFPLERKMQLIRDFLTVIDHAFEECFNDIHSR